MMSGIAEVMSTTKQIIPHKLTPLMDVILYIRF